jgi:hypothetical protein
VRRNYLYGLENGRAPELKKKFISKITDTGYDLMSKAYTQLLLWKRYQLYLESVQNE